ncbi:MAG: TonB-dependent receptor [Acidobacteria bacterium]|nr:TonB-dependent receptor [Acidobacteriota bacterium]
MEDDIVANHTNLTIRVRTGRLAHAVASGLELTQEASENFARTGPTAPSTDLYEPNPSDPYTGPIVRSGASTAGVASGTAGYLFDTVTLGSDVELTGGLRWDRFDVESRAITIDGVVTELGRTDHMLSWRGGAVYKPRPFGSIYVGLGTSFNPSAEGGNFIVGGGAQFMDSVFRNATNTAIVPHYWVLNAIASYDVNQFLTLRLNGNNLANEDYVDRVGGGHFIPGPGRSLSVSATLRR